MTTTMAAPAGNDEDSRPAPPVEAYVLHARDAASLAAAARRVATVAPSLSAAELHDLACQLGRDTSPAGGYRVGIVAASQQELADRAGQAARLVTTVRPGGLAVRPGIFTGNGAGGRVALLLPGLGTGQETQDERTGGTPPPVFGLTDPRAVQPAVLDAALSGLRWLGRLGVTANAAVGHSLGEIAGLVWAGCLTETEAARLVARRSAVISASGRRQGAMVSVAADATTSKALCAGTGLVIAAYNGPRAHVLAGRTGSVREAVRRAERNGIRAVVLDVSHAFHCQAMAGCVAPLRSVLADVAFAPPARRLVSTVTGRVVAADEDLAGLLCAELTSPVRFTEALAVAAADADLLCETGPGHALATLAASSCDVPAVSLEARTADVQGAAAVAAALFAAGAVHTLAPMLAGRTARPVDIWQERITLLSGPETHSTAGLSAAGTHPTAGRPPADVIPIGAGRAAGARGRFLEDIKLHRPGAELVAESRLTAERDPYLAEYRIEGWAVLPAVMALEAMAQAASALAGRPLTAAERVTFGAPVIIRRGSALIRVSAKREGRRVTAVLHSQQAGQWVEHASATLLAGPTSLPAGQAVTMSGRVDGIIDGTDLYESVCFQTGRFRRVAFLPELGSRRCRAVVRGRDDQPWFGAGSQDLPLTLGSPGLNDATLHALQACFPHRRVLPAGCDAVTFSGRPARGAVEIRAVQRRTPTAGSSVPSRPERHPMAWDVTAVDETGKVIVCWTGLRIIDAGPVPGNPPLPSGLLGAYLERGATALGLDPALRIAVRRELPRFGPPAAGLPWRTSTAALSGPDGHPMAPSRRRGWVSASSRGQLDELSLRLRGASPAACAWQIVNLEEGPPERPDEPGGEEFGALRRRLRSSLTEPDPAVHARISTAIECLSKAGRPVGSELVVDGCYDSGWALLHAGDALIACTSVRVIGVSCPVAVSIMTGTGARAVGAA
jgi:malonyl CoA-acyl carrier protein transacylase